CSRLGHKGGADGPLKSRSTPSLVHGFHVALGMVMQELLDKAGLAWGSGGCSGHVGGCLPLGGCFGLGTQIARQTHLRSRPIDDGLADHPLKSGSLPCLVHGFQIALGMALEELPDEFGSA